MGASHSPWRLPAGAEAPERAALFQATSDATEEAAAQGVGSARRQSRTAPPAGQAPSVGKARSPSQKECFQGERPRNQMRATPRWPRSYHC